MVKAAQLSIQGGECQSLASPVKSQLGPSEIRGGEDKRLVDKEELQVRSKRAGLIGP